MNQHISILESRTLLSASTVSTGQLQVDRQNIASDAAALNATLTLFFSQNNSFTRQIAIDFRAEPRSDQYLLSQLERDELKSKAVFSSDAAQLNAKTRVAANVGVNTASSLIAHPSTRGVKVLDSDVLKLNASYTIPLARLNDQIASTSVDSARTAIATLLATDTQLVTDVQAQQTEVNQNRAAVAAAAQKEINDVTALATDLSTVATEIGTYPSLLGSFSGNLTVNAGRLTGETIPVTLNILSEDPTTGKFTGSLSGVDPSGSDPVSGTETLAGNTTLRAITSTQGALTLSGVFASPGLTGKFADRAGRGLFVLSLPQI